MKTVSPDVRNPNPDVMSNWGIHTSGSSRTVECKVCVLMAVSVINAIKPKVLSINNVPTGTRGSNPRGKTTFLTKFG